MVFSQQLQKSKLSCPKYLISPTAKDFLASGSWHKIHATGVKYRDTTEYTAQHVHVARDRLRLQAEHRRSAARAGGRPQAVELRREDGAASQGLRVQVQGGGRVARRAGMSSTLLSK